jgi:hypothetical protein
MVPLLAWSAERMSILDGAGFEFACPKCQFLNSATVLQARLGKTHYLPRLQDQFVSDRRSAEPKECGS